MSEILNILDIFFGVDKLLFWQLIAVSSSAILLVVLFAVFGNDAPRYKSCLVIIIAIALCIIGYAGWVITYYYNVPLGVPLELVAIGYYVYHVQKCTGYNMGMNGSTVCGWYT